jgi:hypothetical protein
MVEFVLPWDAVVIKRNSVLCKELDWVRVQ